MLVGVAALQEGRHYLGVHEQPPGSNSGPFISTWLQSAGVPNHEPWCMAFVHAMFLKVGMALGGGASVGNFEAWARQHGDLVGRPQPGDIACYDWNDDNWPDHVGIVDHVTARHGEIVHFDGSVEFTQPGDVIALEGNTSVQNDSDGGRVMFRPRHPSVCRFARIPGNANR